MGDDEERRKWQMPLCDDNKAMELVKTIYGFNVIKVKSLDSYDDRNFYIKAVANGEEGEYVLKLHNGVESDNDSVIDFQNSILDHMGGQGVSVPEVVKSLNGNFTEYVVLPLKEPTDGVTEYRHAVRMLTWLKPGLLMHEVPLSPQLCIKAGAFIGSVSRSLCDYEHKAANRVHSWDLKNTLGLRDFVKYIDDDKRRKMVTDIIDEFEQKVKPLIDSGKMRTSVIQGDANDANLIVRPRDGVARADITSGDQVEMEGLIDFGDSVRTYTVSEPAIAIAYIMITAATPWATEKKEGPMDMLEAGSCMLSGYNTVFKLTPEEKEILVTLIACRCAMSVTYGAFSYFKQPDNKYLLLHAQPAWYVLETLWKTPRQEILQKLGLPSKGSPKQSSSGIANSNDSSGSNKDSTCTSSSVCPFKRPTGLLVGLGVVGLLTWLVRRSATCSKRQNN